MVPAWAFVGVVFLLSHLLKSSGAVLSVGLVCVLALGVFWGAVVNASSTADEGTTTYSVSVTELRLGAVSPASLPQLIAGIMTGSGTAGGVGSLFALAGISTGLLAMVSIAWVGLPLLVSWHLARVRD